jgi:hypothetical protein
MKKSDGCVEESWEQLHERLHRTAADLQDMLDQLNGRRRHWRFGQRERSLRARLRPAIRWIDATLSSLKPETPKRAAAFVMSLYRLDEMLPQVVDDFHRLLEETGETLFPG